MPLCRPAPLHDVHPWKVLEQTDALALEQSDCPALLEEAFRVVLGEARAVIATAGDKENIAADWNLCKRYADLMPSADLRQVFDELWEEYASELENRDINAPLTARQAESKSHEEPTARVPISPAKRPPVRSISMPAVGSPPKRRGSKPNCPQPLSVRVATDLDSEQEQAEHTHTAERSLERLHPLERLEHGEEAEARRLVEKAMGSVGNRRMAAEGTKSLQLPANRGKPQLVRALASHKKDHWAKLQFREGELLLSYPEAPTGDPLWCMGQNSRGDAGLFYEKDFVTPLDCSPLEKELERLERAQTEAEEGEKSEEEAPALRGWLWKKGYWGLRKSFKKRWFVLKIAQMRLYYFVNKEDEKAGTCRGFIDIKEVTTVHETFYFRTRKKKGDWPFEVHTPDREWLLKADSEETMLKWISKLNGLAHYQDHKRLIDEFRVPAARPKAISGEGASINGPAPPGSGGLPGACEEPAVPSVPKDDDDEFATFGAPFGEEVTNKHTILGDLDKFLGSREPPAVEYVFVEPYLNFARKTGRVFGRWQITLNPYGHAVVRYTLPGTKEQVVMNIVGLAGEELVNFLPPEEFFFGTNFDIKTGNEQGGLYNRNFVSVRVQRVPDERVLAMHQYFLDLANRAHKEKVNYNVIFGPVLNMLGGTMYGNCAYWCSKGLNQVGLVNTISMIPKAIWIDMYELLKANNQQDRLSANTTVVYYKRCLHAKRFYGADADWAGWGRTPSTKYDDLIQLADAVVEIPAGTKTAVVRPGPVRIEEQRRAHAAILKAGAAFSPKIQLTCEVGRRVLYNDYFQRCLDASSLRPLDRSAAGASEEGEGGVRLLSVGCPPWTNSWRVDKAGLVYRSEGRANEPESGSWVHVKAPVAGACTCIEAGEDGSCWAVFGKELFVRKDDADEWQAVPPPEEAADITAISYVTTALVWVLDARGAAFKWKATGHRWVRVASAPPLACLSCGADGEVWAVGKDHRVYRRMAIASATAAAAGALSCHQPHAESGSDSNAEDVLVPSAAALADSDNDTWVEIHGALLKSVSVATAEEVWGVDPDGQAFVWSRQTEQTLPYGKRLIGGKVVEDLARNALGKSHRHWQALGNVQPLSRVSVTSDGTAWAVGKFSRSAIYRLSPHRLVLTTTLSTRKIWDDRKSGARPFQIGLWRPLPPDGFYAFGDLAERSQLENCATPAVVVKEVGKRAGEPDILVAPAKYKRVWTSKGIGGNGKCAIWRPIPPSSDYVALGDVASYALDKAPSVDLVRCIHKDFVRVTQPYQLGELGCLWSTRGTSAAQEASMWLVEPALDGILCNTFVASRSLEAPEQQIGCLKIAV